MRITSNQTGIVLALLLCLCLPAEAQFNQLKKAATKAVKQSVKPLEIDFEVTQVKYDPLKSADKVRLTFKFKGHNPNDLGLRIGRTEFDLYIDEKFAAKMYNDEKIEIPKNGEFEFQEKASIKISTVGKTMFKAIRNDKVAYRIEGTYYVNTPVGEFSFKVDLVEKEL